MVAVQLIYYHILVFSQSLSEWLCIFLGVLTEYGETVNVHIVNNGNALKCLYLRMQNSKHATIFW